MNKCQRCGHGWQSRSQRRPASCPSCKSYKWDEAPAVQKKTEILYDDPIVERHLHPEALKDDLAARVSSFVEPVEELVYANDEEIA